jgi:hypothetical protein
MTATHEYNFARLLRPFHHYLLAFGEKKNLDFRAKIIFKISKTEQ